MIKDQLKYAIKGLSHRKLRSWLTMIGIFIGIAAVVSLIGLGEGLRVAINSQFGFAGVDALSVQAEGLGFAGPPGSGVVTPLTSDLADKIERLNGVEVAIPRYIDSLIIEFNGFQKIGFAMSVPSGKRWNAGIRVMNLNAEEGRILEETDGKKILLGSNYKEKENGFERGVRAGDRVKINDVQFEVVGILEKKGSFIFDNIVALTEEDMINIVGTDEDEVDVIAVIVKDVNQINKVKEDVEKLLRKERGVKKGEEDFSVESPQATLDSLNSSLFAVQLFVYIIAGISIIVGGIGILNTMYTAVLERTKEIGIMKSIGARNNTIFTIFFIESGLLGLMGGLIGVSFGILLAYGGAAAGRAALGINLIQASISPGLVVGALLFSIIIGLVAGLSPARQAAKKHPVDALRFVK